MRVAFMDLVSGRRKGRWRRRRSLRRLSFCFFSLCALLTGGATVGPERRNSPSPRTSLPQSPVAAALSAVPLHSRPPPETSEGAAKPSWWRRRRRRRRKRPAATTEAAAATTWSYMVGPGSYPPRCVSKCGVCTPCKPVHVAVPPGRPVIAEYYPEAWRCKCGGKLYIP